MRLFFIAQAGVQLGVVDCNRCLVGKALQQGGVIRRKHPQVVSKDENNANHLLDGR